MEVTIEKLDNFGRGITYINDKIVFVENALPDETVEIEIINEKKKYLEAKVLNIREMLIEIRKIRWYNNIDK